MVGALDTKTKKIVYLIVHVKISFAGICIFVDTLEVHHGCTMMCQFHSKNVIVRPVLVDNPSSFTDTMRGSIITSWAMKCYCYVTTPFSYHLWFVRLLDPRLRSQNWFNKNNYLLLQLIMNAVCCTKGTKGRQADQREWIIWDSRREV